jgi:N-acetylglucosamine malate deacetylase 1
MSGVPPDWKHLARRLAHATWRGFLRMRSRSWKPATGRRYVVVAPHPDDETLGCGGLIAMSREREAEVDVVFLTDGGAALPNHPTWTPERLTDLRKREAMSALEILGVTAEHTHFLGFQDGRLAHLDTDQRRDLSEQLVALLCNLQPDETAIPWRRDGSSEHEAVFPIVVPALRTARPASVLLEYPVWAWWSPRLLASFALVGRQIQRVPMRSVLDRKRRALEEYNSQMRPMPPWTEAALPARFPQFFLGLSEYFVTSSP